MANLPKGIANKISIVLDKYGLYLKFRTLGPSALKKAELLQLIRAGLIKPTDLRKPVIPDAYMNAHLDLLNNTSRKSVRDYALNHVRESAGKWIDKFIDKAKADLSQDAQDIMLTQRHKSISTLRGELETNMGRMTNAGIAHRIRERSKDLFKDWDRVVTTELAQATNLGSFDAIVENNRSKGADEIHVYKIGPHDGKTCKYCMKFWFLPDGATPRVYKLSELIANGSNFGRKAADWQPTIGITHPNERHVLLELPPSWGFSGSSVVYKSKDHNELKAQRE
jgi:hypothetical protein